MYIKTGDSLPSNTQYYQYQPLCKSFVLHKEKTIHLHAMLRDASENSELCFEFYQAVVPGLFWGFSAFSSQRVFMYYGKKKAIAYVKMLIY